MLSIRRQWPIGPLPWINRNKILKTFSLFFSQFYPVIKDPNTLLRRKALITCALPFRFNEITVVNGEAIQHASWIVCNVLVNLPSHFDVC